MTTKTHDLRTDADVEQIRRALEVAYGEAHPKARIEVYRYNPAAIRIRIIDPDFAGTDQLEREDVIWKILDKLPEEIAAQVTLVLLLTPKEAKRSGASIEFEAPLRLPQWSEIEIRRASTPQDLRREIHKLAQPTVPADTPGSQIVARGEASSLRHVVDLREAIGDPEAVVCEYVHFDSQGVIRITFVAWSADGRTAALVTHTY